MSKVGLWLTCDNLLIISLFLFVIVIYIFYISICLCDDLWFTFFVSVINCSFAFIKNLLNLLLKFFLHIFFFVSGWMRKFPTWKNVYLNSILTTIIHRLIYHFSLPHNPPYFVIKSQAFMVYKSKGMKLAWYCVANNLLNDHLIKCYILLFLCVLKQL